MIDDQEAEVSATLSSVPITLARHERNHFISTLVGPFKSHYDHDCDVSLFTPHLVVPRAVQADPHHQVLEALAEEAAHVVLEAEGAGGADRSHRHVIRSHPRRLGAPGHVDTQIIVIYIDIW